MENLVASEEVGQIVVSDTTNWTALPTNTCRKVKILNNTGGPVDVRVVQNGRVQPSFTVANNVLTYVCDGLGNADEVQVKLTTASGTVTLKYKQFAS